MKTIENGEIDRLFAEQIDGHATEHTRQFFAQLMAHSREGHLCLKSSERFVSDQIVDGTDEMTQPKSPIIHQNGRYYLQRNWVLETVVIFHLRRLLADSPHLHVDATLLSQLNPRQADVVRHAIEHSLTVVTGGPGTGKTFTAGQVIRALACGNLAERPLRVQIAAPTGKAADRLAQSIDPSERMEVESLTIHRLLSLQPGRNRLFEKRQLNADLIIVDEASMIDASLFAHLLAAIPTGARLVLLGDADQLPPIDGGGVFSDLAKLLAIHLEECHRTKEDALQSIYEAARIGNVNPLYTILEPFPSQLIDCLEPMLGALIYHDRPVSSELYERFDHLRLICPLRKGPFGVDAINAAILSRQQKRLSVGQWWAAPIIITNNDSALHLYNGTAGIVLGCYRGGLIPFGDEEVILGDGRSLLLSQLPGYEFAFALSVHKSQGSEYEQVVCYLPPGSEEFAKEALYTAITRAKRSVRIMGDRATLDAMVKTRSQQENGLMERLSNCRFNACG